MTYDYIVVGAGTAGCIVASRLSEDPTTSVLLVEAGRDYPTTAEMPADLLDSRNNAGLAHDWNYTAEPCDGRIIPYRRGKVVGGCSAINAALALRPRPADLAAWAARGNPAWTWSAVAPWLDRLIADDDGPTPNAGGPIPVTRYRSEELIPIQAAFAAACRSIGVAATADHNAPDSRGVGPLPMNRRGTTRISPALAHLAVARSRPNLQIRAEAIVDRLVVEERRTVGIRLAGSGEMIAGRNVILSAGTLASPAVLLRSGIGPAAVLRSLGITPVLDLPGVGDDLSDHPFVPIRLVPRQGESVIGRDPRCQVMARMTAPGSTEPDDMLLVMLSHLDLAAAPILAAEAGVPVVAVLMAALMVPEGRGRVSLTSADPTVPPRIELRFDAHPADLRRLVAGTKLAFTLARSTPLSSATRGIAGLTEATVGSEALLTDYVRANVGTFCHALGTAKMGPKSDPGAVVDQEGRVHGLEGLRVIDASIIPVVLSVVPNLTVMMLAERLVDALRRPGLTA